MMVPSLPVTPEPAVGVVPAGTIRAGHLVEQEPVQALVPLFGVSLENVYRVIEFEPATRPAAADMTVAKAGAGEFAAGVAVSAGAAGVGVAPRTAEVGVAAGGAAVLEALLQPATITAAMSGKTMSFLIEIILGTLVSLFRRRRIRAFVVSFALSVPVLSERPLQERFSGEMARQARQIAALCGQPELDVAASRAGPKLEMDQPFAEFGPFAH